MIDQNTSHHCVVEKMIGGGIGEMYKANDMRLHRLVALKSSPEEVSKDPQASARFPSEPLATAAWKHPKMNPGRGGGAWI
jgi:hypothetical protein